jgi:single-strand DNA-binding protein
MSGEIPLTVIGNLTASPEARFTPAGTPVTSFTIASTPRTFDRESNQWKDGETVFLRASAWGDTAKHAVASLPKGARVVAHGILKARSYETKDGEKRTVHELEVEEIGASLRYNLVTVHRPEALPNVSPVLRIPREPDADPDADIWFPDGIEPAAKFRARP